jgi:hypothetical protein
VGATKTNLEQRALLRPHHRPWPRAGRSTGSEVLRAGEGRPDRRGRWRRRRRAGGRACSFAPLLFFFGWMFRGTKGGGKTSGARRTEGRGEFVRPRQSRVVTNERSGSASRLAWPGSKNASLRSAGLHASAALVGS